MRNVIEPEILMVLLILLYHKKKLSYKFKLYAKMYINLTSPLLTINFIFVYTKLLGMQIVI